MTKHTKEGSLLKPKKKYKKRGNKKGLIMAILCFGFLGLIIARSLSNTNSPEVKKNLVTTAVAGVITDQSISINLNNNKKGYTIDVKYPAISGTGSTLVKGTINSSLKSVIDNSIRDFTDNVSLIAVPGADVSDDSTFSIRYFIKQPVEGVVGVLFDVSEYARGATHQNNSVISKNYLLTTGNEVVLKDIFKPGTDYLSIVSKESISRLSLLFKNEGVTDWFREGASASIDNYNTWYMSEAGLVIIFNPYQVAPYTRGKVEITIPFKSLGSSFVL